MTDENDSKEEAGSEEHAEGGEHGEKSFRYIWPLVLVILSGVTLWQVSIIVIEFSKHETITSLTKESADSIAFPCVTICNYNRWKLSLLTPEAVAEASAAYAKALNGSSQTTAADATSFDIYNFTYYRGWHLIDEANHANFSLQTEYTLLDCTFAGVTCDTKFFTHRMTEYGNCYTFNYDIPQSAVAADSQSGNGLTLPLTQTHATESNGLSLLINVQTYDYAESMLTGGSALSGLKVLIHSREEQPDPTAKGFSISAGQHATIPITKTSYSNLEPPYGECNSSAKLSYFDAYTSSGCEIECKLQVVDKNCSCRMYYYPKSSLMCNVDDTLLCGSKVIAKINKRFNDFCTCPAPCQYDDYAPTVSYAASPNLIMGLELAGKYGMTPAEYWANVASMKIYFSEIGRTTVSQTQAKTMTSVLSDTGGSVGLFLGASIITIFEILERIVPRLRKVAQRNSVSVLPSRGSQQKGSHTSVTKIAY